MRAFRLINKNVKTVAQEFLSGVPADGSFEVVVRKAKKSRSHQQNALLWSWYTIIASHQQTDLEELHEHVKFRLLGVETKMFMGKELCITKSTKKLNVKEMTEYLEGVYQLAQELNIYLPQPEHYGFEGVMK